MLMRGNNIPEVSWTGEHQMVMKQPTQVLPPRGTRMLSAQEGRLLLELRGTAFALWAYCTTSLGRPGGWSRAHAFIPT